MLAISTATKKALIALEHNGKKLYREIDADCRQSENILVAIDDMLQKEGLQLSDVGNFGLVIGPGSFTGLRIGAALVKGFCAGQKEHKVVLISSMDLIAFSAIRQFSPSQSFSCVMNAQGGRFYSATFNKSGKKTKDEHLETAAEVLKGRGAKYCLLEEAFLPNSVTLSCEDLLELALKKQKKGELVPAKDITLKYIRKSSAEEKN